jgi:hypothetical protein
MVSDPQRRETRLSFVNAGLCVALGVMIGLAVSDWWPAEAWGRQLTDACRQAIASFVAP